MAAMRPLRVEKPGSVDCAFISVRRNRPAEMRSNSDIATCVTTSAWRRRARRDDAVTAAADSLSALTTEVDEPWSAGTRPKTSAVTVVIPAANNSTTPLIVGLISIGSGAGGTNHCARFLVQ